MVKGNFEIKDDNWVEITELPVGKWTKDYKEFLEGLMEGEKAEINELKEHHTNNRVHF